MSHAQTSFAILAAVFGLATWILGHPIIENYVNGDHTVSRWAIGGLCILTSVTFTFIALATPLTSWPALSLVLALPGLLLTIATTLFWASHFQRTEIDEVMPLRQHLIAGSLFGVGLGIMALATAI